MAITDLVVHYGDVIELKDQNFDLKKIQEVLDASPYWVQYNPRKDIKRFGLSLTSLDGKYSGVPDLDSLREFNEINGTSYSEKSFRTRTPIVEELSLSKFLDIWEPWLGRAHFLRLDAGGFFPPHRDNGIAFPPNSIRILVPIRWNKRHAVWIQDGKILDLEEGQAYFVNTTKEHSLFSYRDGNILLVLNIITSMETSANVVRNAKVL